MPAAAGSRNGPDSTDPGTPAARDRPGPDPKAAAPSPVRMAPAGSEAPPPSVGGHEPPAGPARDRLTSRPAPRHAAQAPQAVPGTQAAPSGDDRDELDGEDLSDGADMPLTAPDAVPLPRPVRLLPRVIAVANQKGGVGKTTTTVNLGASLALFGYRVLIVDLDPQGNATTGLGVDARGFQHSMYDVLLNDTPMVDCIEPVGLENLFVAPATLDLAGVEQELFSALSRELRLQRALATVIDDYDFIFVDCPPSLGLITINAFAAAREILVPVQCEFYALEGLTQLQRIVELVQKNLNEQLEITTVVLTMYDARTRLSEDVANEVRRHFPTQTQGTVIPRTVRLSEAPSFGQPITTFDPASKGARAYKALAREVSDGAQKRAG